MKTSAIIWHHITIAATIVGLLMLVNYYTNDKIGNTIAIFILIAVILQFCIIVGILIRRAFKKKNNK